MIITRKQAVSLFKALGYNTADKWDSARMQVKINNLPELVTKGQQVEDKKQQTLLDTIMKKRRHNKVVTIEESGEPEATKVKSKEKEEAPKKTDDEQTDKKKETKKEKEPEKQPKKKEAKKEAKKDTIGTDKFGNRLGSDAAKLNACLAKKPKTMSELTKEAKLTTSFYNHLNKLIEAKHIVKVEKGYAIK